MKLSVVLLAVLALTGAACAQQTTPKRSSSHAECQMNGENTAACNRGFASEFLDMKQEQPENL